MDSTYRTATKREKETQQPKLTPKPTNMNTEEKSEDFRILQHPPSISAICRVGEKREETKSKNSVMANITYHRRKHLETKWIVLKQLQMMEVVLRLISWSDKLKLNSAQTGQNFTPHCILSAGESNIWKFSLSAFCIVRWVRTVTPCSLIERKILAPYSGSYCPHVGGSSTLMSIYWTSRCHITFK